ncbi:MAG: MFS transporter [Acidimicrobiales bacterium]
MPERQWHDQRVAGEPGVEGVEHAIGKHHVPLWMVLALVCVGQFMVVLDLSIVNVALPSMQRDLGFSTSQLQWVVNAYALTFGGFLLLGGRAADLFGRRRVFILGLALFTGASLVCAVAQNQGMLIGARALQGLGGAVLSPATLTILTTAFYEPRERARALGIWSSMAAVGGASGALLGGLLTDLLSWRWIFYINVPIGIAAIAAARFVLVETRLETDRPHLDILGSLTVTGGLVAFVYAVAGTDVHPWLSGATLVPLALSVGLGALFVFVELRVAASPLVPFGLFRSRGVAGANLTMLMLGGAMFSMWLFLSLYMQDVLHFSPLTTGLGFLPQTAATAIGAQISARLVPRFGPRTPLLIGGLATAFGLAWLSRAGPTGTYLADILGGGVLATAGMGLAITPLAFAATTGVARHQAGLASGVLNTSRQVGGSIALAALATVAAARTSAVLHDLSHTAAHVAAALTSGFDRTFAVGACIALGGAGAALLVPGATPPVGDLVERDPATVPAAESSP